MRKIDVVMAIWKEGLEFYSHGMDVMDNTEMDFLRLLKGLI